MTVCLW